MAGADVANVDNKHERASGGGAVGAVDDRIAQPVGSTRDDARDHVSGDRRGGSGAVAPIPASIVKAICAVMVTVEAVKKSNRNQHGGYNFASTDDIYAAVTRKMGEVGLIIVALEDKAEIKRIEKDGKVSQWMHAEFSFVLATEQATWSDPRARRTLYIQVTGAQTFQAAQSYAEKAYIRSLFKLPTGDVDLDSMPQADDEETQVALSAKPKRKSSAASKRDGDDVVFNELRGAISGADGPADLQKIWNDNISVINALPHRWHEIVQQEHDDKMRDFMEAAE